MLKAKIMLFVANRLYGLAGAFQRLGAGFNTAMEGIALRLSNAAYAIDMARINIDYPTWRSPDAPWNEVS